MDQSSQLEGLMELLDKKEMEKALELDLRDLEVMKLEEKIAPAVITIRPGVRPCYGIVITK